LRTHGTGTGPANRRRRGVVALTSTAAPISRTGAAPSDMQDRHWADAGTGTVTEAGFADYPGLSVRPADV
jgi:hypothetical protein